jgi:hypothetical protein
MCVGGAGERGMSVASARGPATEEHVHEERVEVIGDPDTSDEEGDRRLDSHSGT